MRFLLNTDLFAAVICLAKLAGFACGTFETIIFIAYLAVLKILLGDFFSAFANAQTCNNKN
jgi:hypothetical protein